MVKLMSSNPEYQFDPVADKTTPKSTTEVATCADGGEGSVLQQLRDQFEDIGS